MRFLRTNTAVRLTVGPFFDKSDGITPETSLTVTNCKLTLMVDDANVPTLVLDTNPTASGGANDMVHVSGDDAGFYDLELAAGNVNYLGRAMLALTDAANHCPVFHEFMILPAMIYDSLILGTDRLDTNVTHVADTSQTGRDLGASVLLSSGSGTGQIDLSSGKVLLQATQSGVTIPTVTTLTNAPSDSSGVTTLLSRIPSGLFTGITSLAQWLGLIAGKQTGNSTARTEVRATGAGSGTYDETTDSQEAIRDNMAGSSVDDIADGLLDRVDAIETGLTPRGALRLALAALAGKASGLNSTTAVYRNAVADSKDRITATVTIDGNRTAVTTDVS